MSVSVTTRGAVDEMKVNSDVVTLKQSPFFPDGPRVGWGARLDGSRWP